jgi:hypothetical protein
MTGSGLRPLDRPCGEQGKRGHNLRAMQRLFRPCHLRAMQRLFRPCLHSPTARTKVALPVPTGSRDSQWKASLSV